MKNNCRLIAFFVLLVFAAPRLKAGQTYFSLITSANLNGSGFAPGISPHLALNVGRSSFTIGPNIQEKKWTLTGLYTGYRYTMTENYSGRVRLFCFTNLFLHKQAYLSRNAVRIEKMAAGDKSIDYSNVRFRAFEMYGGFGLQFIHSDRISTACSAGLGFYTTTGSNDICRHMYRSTSGCGLQLRATVSYSFGKNRTTPLYFRNSRWDE
jgi:hypothetical protein